MIGHNGHRLSASGIDRALLCAYSFVAPHPWRDVQLPSGRLGSAFHAHAEDTLRHPWDVRSVGALVREYQLAPAQERDLRIMIQKWETWQQTQFWDGAQPEVKIAFDPATCAARLLSATGHRDYADAQPDELTGTVDVLQQTASGVSSIDWKTGRFVDHPGESVQQRTYALGAHLLTRADTIDARVVRVSGNPDESVIDLRATFVASELADFGATLVQLRSRIRDPTQQPQPSALACRYCPIKQTCPAAYKKPKETDNAA